jgi:hypothetical protein
MPDTDVIILIYMTVVCPLFASYEHVKVDFRELQSDNSSDSIHNPISTLNKALHQALAKAPRLLPWLMSLPKDGNS